METERVDLATELVRETYRNPRKTPLMLTQTRPLHQIRKAVTESKRFMLDGAMSEFLAELASIPFKVVHERRPDVLDSLRHSAIPPFEKMFIQLDGRAFRKGLLRVAERHTDVWGQELLPPEGAIVEEIGLLIERLGDSVMCTEFFQSEGHMVTLPFTWAYQLNDVGMSEHWGHDTRAGMFAHGITGLHDRCIAVCYFKPVDQHPKKFLLDVVHDKETPGPWDANLADFKVHYLVPEFGGVIRYILAFLATLNNVPKTMVEVRPSKGYIAGGQRRKYLDHTVLRLSLPAKQSTTMVAKRLIAAARRGWHEVRAHWRITHPHLGGNYCATREAHIWGAADMSGHATCRQCEAKRVWIVLPHGRGDPTISVRTHKYAVTHQV